jgi:hypothetical protein
MIQRKQSIWLFLASLSILLTFVIPYGLHSETTADSIQIIETALKANNNMLVMSASIASAAFSFFLIFLYQNRKLQMRLTLLAVLVSLSVIVFQFIDATNTANGNKIAIGIVGNNLFAGMLVPLLSAFLLMLAYAGIHSDEKLIRDSDRLR